MRRALIIPMLLFATPVFAQHAGLRQQWQPQTESDPRLQQRVETELVCISTRRGLPRLAEKTGVSLSVAPENLDTTGERKFTLIAQGCTLKEIMVQLCEALRECHWDVDTSGAQPAYLLHRNAGVEAAEEERQRTVQADAEARRREERTTRIEEARRALAMGPEEVAQLEKTDLLLARALRYPPMRDAMEAFFAFPPEQIRRFAETGELITPYSELPERAQRLLLQAAQETLVGNINQVASDPEEQGSLPEGFLTDAREQLRSLPTRIQRATVYAIYSSPSLGLAISLRGEGGGQVVIAIPPRYARAHSGIFEHLLAATGDTKDAAAQALQQEWDDRQQQRREEEEQRLREWALALAPEVERTLSTAFDELLRPSALEKAAAERTGLSVVADAFWSDHFEVQMDKPAHPATVREALDVAAAWAAFEWWTVGRCLVVRHNDWYEHAQRDVPESVVLQYREKLRTQGRFTLDDAVALAAEVSDRQRPVPRGWMSLPQDLAATGVGDLTRPRLTWAPALLLSLTPEQRARAERPEGLRLADLSQRQRDQAALAGGRWGQAMQEPAAVFRATKSEGIEEGRRYTQYDFRLEWGEGEQKQWTAWARLFDTRPAASDDGR